MSSLINLSLLVKKLTEYKTEIKDNSQTFLKWHNDSQKEEALQTNFLNDIFGKVLGYEIDTGEAEFNMLSEYKTQKDGTKVDGVLGFITRDKKDIRVAIELKAKNTTNLDSVEKQAFEYRDKIDGIEWVITSNTNEIRLYSAGSGGRLKHQSWTFLELANSPTKQREFHFLLSKDRLFSAEKSTSPTHKLLEENTKEENEIKNNDIHYHLTLSGHTHGMQFGIEIPGWFRWSPIQYVYKQWAGLYENAGRYIYVNRGFGFHAYPGRVGIMPEITVIELKKTKKEA